MHFVDSKGILSPKNGMNTYRGCTHGCIYCDSRSKCYNFTHDFEDIEVKQNAPELLEKALISKRKKCMIGTGAMCDPYMPCEEKLGITRLCLELINKYEYGLAILTKSDLILRDLDLLKSINEKSKCVVQITLTTYDEELCKVLEPNVCSTKRRFEVLKICRDNGIPTIVWLDPILPFINDTRENIEGVLGYCVEANVKGIMCFGMGLTLREGNREYFYEKLDEHFPGLRMKYHQKFGYAYQINSDNNKELMQLLRNTCRAHNIIYNPEEVFSYLYEFPESKRYDQMTLFN
jgi:DNA repair photolyase